MSLAVHSHETYVQFIAGGRGGAFAVCATCGWQGPTRSLRARARDDGRRHAERTGYRWDDAAKRMVPR